MSDRYPAALLRSQRCGRVLFSDFGAGESGSGAVREERRSFCRSRALESREAERLVRSRVGFAGESGAGASADADASRRKMRVAV